jgi:hypothetical protein
MRPVRHSYTLGDLQIAVAHAFLNGLEACDDRGFAAKKKSSIGLFICQKDCL